MERTAAEAKAAGERKRRRLTVVLAAWVLLTLLAAGGTWLWADHRQAARRATTAQAVEERLVTARQSRDRGRWAEALAAVREAEGLLADGGNEALARRVRALREELEQDERDRRLVARLDAIRRNRATTVEGRFNNAQADRDYEAAFREARLGEALDEPASVAVRVRASPVRSSLSRSSDCGVA